MEKHKIEIAKGLTLSNLFAFTLVGLSKYLKIWSDGILIFSEFILVPLIMGIICAWCWKKLNHNRQQTINYSLLNSFLAILFSAVFLREGVICLIIVSPLIWAFILTGLTIGKRMFKKNNSTLNVSIFSLLLFVFVADSISEHNYSNMVSDELIINAPPEKIWKNVVSFDPIKEKEDYWLFKIGMPSPMQTTVDGNYKGAGRKCIFSNGYIFDEKIVNFQPNKNLTFDIIGQPRDPEIMGHIDIQRGQFILKDNGNGTTTLIGNSWYKLYVFPVWYYDLWAESITRNVHLRVMKHIKKISEAN